MLLVLIIVLLVVGLPGGWYGYRQGYYGPGGFGLGGVIILILVLWLLLGAGGFGHLRY